MKSFFLSILFMLIVKAAFANSEYRCGVSLIFDSDGTGSVANYILSLQVKNTTGRNINGVSVIYKDKEGEVIGNAALQCSVNSSDIKPGSYGECVRPLQRVDGEYINSFGIKKWTEIVNTQLEKLKSIQLCDVLGFSY